MDARSTKATVCLKLTASFARPANFKKYTRKTPIQFLTDLRLTNAQVLLESTTYSVNEVAHPLYFSRLFHKQKGCAPSEYRNRSNNYQTFRSEPRFCMALDSSKKPMTGYPHNRFSLPLALSQIFSNSLN